MSSQCSPALPPPIVDRVSGKTFIAVPAPPFIATQISKTDSIQANFVYVETKAPSLKRMFTPERSGILCTKRPVDQWMDGVQLSDPPPDHIPWTGYVDSDGDSPTEEVPLFTTTSQRRQSTDSSRLSVRSSLSGLPSFASASTLLRASLPSLSSSMSSDFSVPNFWEAKAAVAQLNASTTTARTIGQRSYQHNRQSTRNSGTTTTPLFEENLRTPNFLRKVDDSLTIVNSVAEKPQEAVVAKMERLEDLDAFLSNGLKKMDSTLRRITLHREQLQPPMLVVSTSQAAMPLSLESSTDIHRASSIAQRRGRSAPGPLNLEQKTALQDLDYPSLPTAFRGTPISHALEFPLSSTSSRRESPVRFTIEEMIFSLQAHIKSLESEPPSPHTVDSEAEAMEWLESELSQEENAWNDATKGSTGLKSTEKTVSRTTRLRSATESVHRSSASTAIVRRISTRSSKDSAPTSVSRSGLRRATISTMSESAKKVKFSVGPPITIPHDILDKTPGVVSTSFTENGHNLSPKRKPPPVLSSITSSSGLLTPPPIRFGNRSRSPALSGPPKGPLPPLPKQIKRRASEAALALGSNPVQIDDMFRVRASLDGPRSIRKPKQQMRMADFLGGKKRATDENAPSVEIREKKTEKTKLRGRVLPFQNMLNRFRS
ncbi:hypothetical protein SCHPADRAFT_993874 [Schizopora paradoxa]|uniref:Uncharacterized protein n=1 Tax=Schizopora paradoxa TaxID=27342 RepID=A0A0H2S167_9AGAM|nr:hypothetical protein SCHPADRAFT_993874 [Schizopora paradoxa]